MADKSIRAISKIVKGIPAEDGAGVKLKRILGSPELEHLDPFLLLDEFRSDNPDEYIAGFPSHPHRGFETVTFLKQGNFRHRDSRGNEGFLGPGSVQWMTAGRGIIHSEMPETQEGLLWGYQLWLNLPAREKMIEPAYQDIPADAIPRVAGDDLNATVICGDFRGVSGPAKSRYPVLYIDVELRRNRVFRHVLPSEMNAFAYVYSGTATVGSRVLEAGMLGVLGSGDEVDIRAGEQGASYLLLAATPLKEAIARAGPFVMNTREEIMQAFRDYQNGTLA